MEKSHKGTMKEKTKVKIPQKKVERGVKERSSRVELNAFYFICT
jgi:hypothetical protein